MSIELSFFEQMGGTYTEKDGFLYPNLLAGQETEHIEVGKYGLLWISFMKENYPDRYRHHIRMGQLQSRAAEVNEEAYTLDEDFSKEKLEEYFAEEKYFGDYTEPKIYSSGLALRYKPKSDLQKRYYAKVYRLHVVQKYRFRYHYTRYKEDLEQMHKLQEEYLFLCRKDINSWADVFEAQRNAKKKVAEIDACKKELYKDHAKKKYQYEKDGDAAVFLFHEAEYRKKLEELKAERKEAKNEKNVAERCLKQNLYACLEVPDDLDIENLYLTDLPKMEKQEVVKEDVDSSIEEVVVPMAVDSEIVDEQIVDVVESVNVQEYGEIPNIKDMVEDSEPEFYETTVDMQLPKPEMTRELYESLTDKEKANRIGITPDNTDESIRLFTDKMKTLGVFAKFICLKIDLLACLCDDRYTVINTG